ncbi:NAD-dependent epimerase/dehydratase family protein [Phycisphaerales bacterium AB-hyl4]|uniref:NAD-dependent epimerase/dehydratase family protein n=1 Tax=Natronomicrosphaera hydrolytica TaxID=3242702 RepID=A0ABV4U6Q0_9BACT
MLITGGAGFIGANLAHRLLSEGRAVIVFDNLARPGVVRNVEWLRREHGAHVQFEMGDVRNPRAVNGAVGRAGAVFHFAAQVAVTTSLDDPRHDFEVNARGTLNVLEAMRACDEPPPMLYTSTNKVYGSLEGIELREEGSRYWPIDAAVARHGVGEQRLSFQSPYGCSKGSADQYVLDYARSFGLPCIVFRMSCIYGPHQCGTEDQGWVAHFVRSVITGEPITLFGDGRQVRDLLFVDDLVDAMTIAVGGAATLRGRAFNIGGGVEHTVSLLELTQLLRQLHGRSPTVRHGEWRGGDQRYYVSDIRRFAAATGWRPRVSVREGVERVHAWTMREGATEGLGVVGRTVA